MKLFEAGFILSSSAHLHNVSLGGNSALAVLEEFRKPPGVNETQLQRNTWLAM